NSTLAPAWIAASGVAMNVLEGHSTVWPSTPAKWSAASAPPAQLERATAGSWFQASQPDSNRPTIEPSDHWFESRTSSISVGSRARSRWSKPIANFEKSGVVEAVVILLAGVREARLAACSPANGATTRG